MYISKYEKPPTKMLDVKVLGAIAKKTRPDANLATGELKLIKSWNFDPKLPSILSRLA